MQGISVIQTFIIIGAAQGLILSLYFGFKKKGQELLAFSFLLLSFRLFAYPFLSILPAWLCSLSLISLLLVGPLIYGHVLKKVHQESLKWTFSVHAIPFLAYALHLIFPVFWLPLSYSYATLYTTVFYGILSIVVLQASTMDFSKEKKVLYNFAFSVLLFPLSIMALAELNQRLLGLHPATFPYLILTILLSRLSFIYISQAKSQDFSKKPVLNPLDPEKLDHLVRIVEQQKLYQNQQISVAIVSEASGLTRHEISQLINTGIGLSFHHFINRYRVESVKQKLLDPDFNHLSIDGIGMDSGFKSRSTFYRVFKEMTGETPLDFRNRYIR